MGYSGVHANEQVPKKSSKECLSSDHRQYKRRWIRLCEVIKFAYQTSYCEFLNFKFQGYELSCEK